MLAACCRWAAANWCCCPRISCTPRATSTSTIRSAEFFSRAIWVSLISGVEAREFVTELAPHIPRMEGFHRRYMASNKILRLWTRMARKLDVKMLVPQHGAPIVGRQAIADFYDWLDGVNCGIDLVGESMYQYPSGAIDVK